MKIIVLGAAGMLGHVAAIYLKEKYGPGVIFSARNRTGIALIDQDLHPVDLFRFEDLRTLIEASRPCVVVNCAAINDGRRDPKELQAINADLPQNLAVLLDGFEDGSRLIHISTDGVFDGSRGQYSEDDPANAQDPYGASKFRGEVTRPGHLTIRTSIIGLDPVRSRGLVHWFLSQSGEANGFSQVFWSGVTTLELARFIDHAIAGKTTGLYHLGGECVSKYDLLVALKSLFQKQCRIVLDAQAASNRCLVSRRKDVGYTVPPVSRMLEQWKLWIKQHPQIYRAVYSDPAFWDGS